MFALLLREVVQTLHTKCPAVERPRVSELDDEWSAVRSLGTCAKFGLWLEDHSPLVHRAEASPFGPVRKNYVKKTERSSKLMRNRRQGRKVKRNSLREEGVQAGVECLA